MYTLIQIDIDRCPTHFKDWHQRQYFKNLFGYVTNEIVEFGYEKKNPQQW